MGIQEIGEVVRVRRSSFGLSQVELAEIAGISYRPIVQLERGRSIRLDTLMQICAALGLELDVAVPARLTSEES